MKALTNGKVLTVSSGTLERGTVLMDGGRIIAVGTDIVIFSAHPFDYRAVAEKVFVDGELVYTRSGGLS